MRKLSSLLLATIVGFSAVSCSDDDPVVADVVTPTLKSATFDYKFNTGQISPAFTYTGEHAKTLAASIKLEEQAAGTPKVTVTLNNTLDAKTYNVHAHDAADAATTPNKTPYNETPNADVFAKSVVGNGGTVSVSQVSTKSYAELTATYKGFFVVHDPLQAISTKNPATYVILGSFARK
jgi:hypothetical protein